MAKTAILLKLEPGLLARIDEWAGDVTRTGKVTKLIEKGLASNTLPAVAQPVVVQVREHIVTPTAPRKAPKGIIGYATDGTPLTRPRSFQKPGKPK